MLEEGLAKTTKGRQDIAHPPSRLSLSRGHEQQPPPPLSIDSTYLLPTPPAHNHRANLITCRNATMPPSPTATPESPFQHHPSPPHSLNTPPHPPPASHSPSGPHYPAPAPASASGSPRPRLAFPPPSRQTHDRDEEARRSLQARGKNYNTTPGTSSRGGRGEQGGSGWTWEARQKRDEAARILESEELLMWFAGTRCEVSCPLFPPSFFYILSFLLPHITCFGEWGIKVNVQAEYTADPRALQKCTSWA